MELISRISKIQESLRELVDELEALKLDFVGESPVKSDPAQQHRIIDQMKDFISKGGV